MGPQKIIVALPAFNEASNLPDLLENFERSLADISLQGLQRLYVIVDDGSKDNTMEVLWKYSQRLPINIIAHELNQGLGPTIRDALRKACELADDTDIIITMDADNTHPTDLIQKMVWMIVEGNDVVIASRYRRGSYVVGLHWFRRIMSLGARLLMQLTFPIPGVRDFTCGYRAYRALVLKQAFAGYGDEFIEHQGFQCMADILLRLRFMGVKMTEVPMILRYDRKRGGSSMSVAKTIINTLILVIRRRFEKKPDWIDNMPFRSIK